MSVFLPLSNEQRLRSMASDARRDAWSDWLIDASPTAPGYVTREAVATEWNADANALDEAADELAAKEARRG